MQQPASGDGGASGGVPTDGSTGDGWGFHPKRRTFVKLVGASGLATARWAGRAGATESTSGEPWTVVALPDTQGYAESTRNIEHARRQTVWVVENLDQEDIAFVTHEGDVVEHGADRTEWRRMHDVMATLDGHVPYSVVPGDHDWFVEEDRASATRYFRQYFGASRYRDREWHGGSGPFDLSHYQRFSAGGYDFLHLGLEWEAPGDVDDPETPLGWAQSVLDDHADRPTIITTHSYLRDADPAGRTTRVEEQAGHGSSGETLWQELVRPNPQVFVVLSGNAHAGRGADDGEFRQVSTNEADLPVYELLADFQDYPNGGDGWLRLVRFVPGEGDGDRIEVQTYSPSLDRYQTGDASEFQFRLDFDERFDEITTRVTFRQGEDGYDGVVDTYIQSADPDADNADAKTLNVDADDPQGSAEDVQALLRFDDLVGDDDGPVPAGSTVVSATLRLRTTATVVASTGCSSRGATGTRGTTSVRTASSRTVWRPLSRPTRPWGASRSAGRPSTSRRASARGWSRGSQTTAGPSSREAVTAGTSTRPREGSRRS